jgi:HSP90 family molecular chaperone
MAALNMCWKKTTERTERGTEIRLHVDKDSEEFLDDGS